MNIFAQECANDLLGQIFDQNSGNRSGCVDITDYSGSYEIPVAIHVIRDIHGNGNWPPDSEIQFMINNANEYLAPQFKLVPISNPNDCGSISFRPNEIRQDISTDMNSQLAVKGLSRVNPALVCNIWLVRNVIGGNGFAYNPRGTPFNDAIDGIVVEKDRIHTTTLVHEVGHYLGLHHVWGPREGDPTNCYEPHDACSFGDDVEDTPRSIRRYPFANVDCTYSNLENLEEEDKFFCVHGEPIPCDNIMGYSTNRNILTQGQRDLMISTINLYRSSLGAYNNSCLTCDDPCKPCYYGTPPIDPNPFNPFDDFCSPCHAGHVHLNETVINGVVNITQPTLITKDLTIYGTLNVNSDLYVAPGKTIFVNSGTLVIGFQGHLTACRDNWNGIGSFRGNIQMYGGTISKANIGIASANHDTKIRSYLSFFNENKEDVILTGNDDASFESTTFLGSQNGVKLYGLSKVTHFNNCTFGYQTGSGIETNYGSSIDVSNNNQFTGCSHAISLGNFFGTASLNDIGNFQTSANQFTNCYNALYSVNSFSSITNNYFYNNNYGLVFRGLNGFKSESNTYTGSSYAELIDAAGDNINHSFGNQYSSTEGIYPHNYNMGYNFYNNCFRTLWWDVNALDIINPAQFGPGDKAAGNCFTHGGVKDFICTTGNTVTYGIPNVVASECFYPDNSGGWNYNTSPADFSPSTGCGAGAISENQYGYIIRMECDFKRLKKSIDSLQLLIKKIKDLPNSNGSFFNSLRINILERHLRFAINHWAWCIRKEGRFRDLKEWYKTWSKEYPQDKYFALDMTSITASLREYSLAKTEIDSIARVHHLHPDIVTSIKMSVDVLQIDDPSIRNIDNAGRIFSSSELIYRSKVSSYILDAFGYQLLYRVAKMTVPEAAYGRALLSYLTGEMIDPDQVMPISGRSKNVVHQNMIKEIYSIYPNPSSDMVTIKVQFEDPNATYNYSIMNTTGQIIMTGTLRGESQLLTSEIPSGIYAIKILKNNQYEAIKKLIIQK